MGKRPSNYLPSHQKYPILGTPMFFLIYLPILQDRDPNFCVRHFFAFIFLLFFTYVIFPNNLVFILPFWDV